MRGSADLLEDVHGEQPRHQQYDREESREYRLKIDLPSFDG